MSREATIYDPRGAPLGTVVEVKRALMAAFVGIKFSVRLSGAQKLQAALDMGVELPEEIREELAEQPERLCGEYQTVDFSVQFLLLPADPVTQVDIHHYGSLAAAEAQLQKLREQTGWEIAFPE